MGKLTGKPTSKLAGKPMAHNPVPPQSVPPSAPPPHAQSAHAPPPHEQAHAPPHAQSAHDQAHAQSSHAQSSHTPPPSEPQRVDLKRLGDWTSWSSWLILLGMLPFSALSVAGFVWLPALFWGDSFGGGSFVRNLIVLTAAYFVLLPFIFLPGMNWLQIKLIAPDSRSPTTQERSRLRPAWRAVLSRVGKGSNRHYQLRVIDSNELNAYAGGGRMVIITSLAIRMLPQAELEAVLSHELGHHSGMHPIVLLANSWLTRPIVWFHSLLRFVHDLLIWIINHAGAGWFRVTLLVIMLVPRAVIGLLALVWKVATLLLLFFGRQAEHQADATAVKLGYGHNLINALNTMEDVLSAQGGNEIAPELSNESLVKAGLPPRKTAWDTHPPTTKRVQKITRALAR